MEQALNWTEKGLDLINLVLLFLLWRSYRRHESVAPQMYLFIMLFSGLFLGLYIAAMPAGQFAADLRFAVPATVVGLLWGFLSARGMILFRTRGHYFLRGSLWVPIWTTLNLIGGKMLELYGLGLLGAGGLVVMIIATMATLMANLVLLITLLVVRRYYAGPARKGRWLHFCHACGTGYQRGAWRCPTCGVRKEKSA